MCTDYRMFICVHLFDITKLSSTTLILVGFDIIQQLKYQFTDLLFLPTLDSFDSHVFGHGVLKY